jgi:hypothetical protein
VSFAGYSVGDIVRLIDTVTIVGKDGDRLRCEDVKNKQRFWVIGSDALDSSLKIEMVKKAAPTVKAGDILTGQEIRERQWKQGTVIQCLRHGWLSPLLLSAYGKWVGSHREEFDFDLLVEDADFKLLHVA